MFMCSIYIIALYTIISVSSDEFLIKETSNILTERLDTKKEKCIKLNKNLRSYRLFRFLFLRISSQVKQLNTTVNVIKKAIDPTLILPNTILAKIRLPRSKTCMNKYKRLTSVTFTERWRHFNRYLIFTRTI